MRLYTSNEKLHVHSYRGIAINIALFLLLFSTSTQMLASTEVFVLNKTNFDIEIANLSVTGDPLSKKAWQKKNTTVSAGQRSSVLLINRTGKFNWMDPTPRFIEPGKTAVFTIELASKPSDQLVTIKQKLVGTGSGSTLWYAVESEESALEWVLPFEELSGTLANQQSGTLRYLLRAIETKKDDALELVISNGAD